MGNFIAKLIDSDSDSTSGPRLINSETESQIPNMEVESIIDDCTIAIKTENGNRMNSKQTVLLLDFEEKSKHDDSQKQTENVYCKLPELLQTEEIIPNISNRTKTECNINTRKLEKANSNRSKHASIDKQNESPEQNINNAVSQSKGLKRVNSNTTKKSSKRAKSSQPISKSKGASEKNVKLTVTFSTEYKFNTHSTLQSMESLISRRRIIYSKRQEAKEKLARMENEALHNIRKQKKKKVRRSPRTKKLNPTFSSVYFFNLDSNMQCMESIIQRRKFTFNKKQQELKKCKQSKKQRKQKPKTNKRKVKKGSKQSKSQNNNMPQYKDKNLPCVQQSDMSYCSSCMFCNKYHEYRLPKQYKEHFTNIKKESPCAIM